MFLTERLIFFGLHDSSSNLAECLYPLQEGTGTRPDYLVNHGQKK